MLARQTQQLQSAEAVVESTTTAEENLSKALKNELDTVELLQTESIGVSTQYMLLQLPL